MHLLCDERQQFPTDGPQTGTNCGTGMDRNWHRVRTLPTFNRNLSAVADRVVGRSGVPPAPLVFGGGCAYGFSALDATRRESVGVTAGAWYRRAKTFAAATRTTCKSSGALGGVTMKSKAPCSIVWIYKATST